MDGGAHLYPRGAESTGIKKAFPSNTFQYFWRGLISGGNLIGQQGWWSGESTRLPSMWPGFNSVVGSLLCSERFSGFPLSSKTSLSKFQFDQESGRPRNTKCMCYLPIVFYLLFVSWEGGGGRGGGLKVLIQDTHHLCTLFGTDGIKVMSRGFSGGK